MTRPAITVLDPAQYRRTPWKNGGGVTIDIAGAYRSGASPGGWEGMLWRFGRTRIERPGPFSELSGFDRILAVVEGTGLVLHPHGRASLDVRVPFRPVRFAGEWQIGSELTAGPVGVLNLMADRTQFEIDLVFAEAGATLPLRAGHAVVWAIDEADVSIGGQTVRLTADGAVACAIQAEAFATLLRGRVAVASVHDRAEPQSA